MNFEYSLARRTDTEQLRTETTKKNDDVQTLFSPSSDLSKLPPLLPDLDKHLARVLPLEERDERSRGVGEPFEAGLAELEFAGTEERGEVVFGCRG
jgi:hypothetical protein